jgi:large subunit ribosomal protein L6
MSRVERNPISIPAGVEVLIEGQLVKVKGKKSSLEWRTEKFVHITKDGNILHFTADKDVERALVFAGTARALIKNMIHGVSEGYQKKLLLEGVGYRAQAQGNILNLTVGFSHPIKYKLPDGITAETPTQTEIVLKGADKHMLGQVAATIRGFQPPEPYKGKGIRYEGEVIVLKEGKKK